MTRLNNEALDTLFVKARTFTAWQEKQVPDSLLQELYDLCKWGPTSQNCCPMRLVFVTSKEGKEKLEPALMEGNVEKTMKAPATAIIGYDLAFFEQLPKLWPQQPNAKDRFAADPAMTETAGFRNGSLEGAYLIMAARALGLDCGPMSGFNNAKLDEIFFSGTKIKSNFLCNLGYGDPAKLFPRGPRLTFDEVAKIV